MWSGAQMSGRRSIGHVVVLVFSLLCALARAETTSRHDEDYDSEMRARRAAAVAGIPRLVKQYGETIGCEFSMNPANVVPFQGARDSAYIALFDIDEGCSGGTAMSRPVIAVLGWGGGSMDKLFIDASVSLPANASAFPQWVSRIYAQGTGARFVAFELRPGDALCCHTGRIAGKLTWDPGRSAWVPVKR